MTIEQLKKLSRIRALMLDDEGDSIFASDRNFHTMFVDDFLQWVEGMSESTINHLLKDKM